METHAHTEPQAFERDDRFVLLWCWPVSPVVCVCVCVCVCVSVCVCMCVHVCVCVCVCVLTIGAVLSPLTVQSSSCPEPPPLLFIGESPCPSKGVFSLARICLVCAPPSSTSAVLLSDSVAWLSDIALTTCGKGQGKGGPELVSGGVYHAHNASSASDCCPAIPGLLLASQGSPPLQGRLPARTRDRELLCWLLCDKDWGPRLGMLFCPHNAYHWELVRPYKRQTLEAIR